MSESQSSYVSNSDSEDDRLLREDLIATCIQTEMTSLLVQNFRENVHSPVEKVSTFEEPDSQDFLNLDTHDIGKYIYLLS